MVIRDKKYKINGLAETTFTNLGPVANFKSLKVYHEDIPFNTLSSYLKELCNETDIPEFSIQILTVDIRRWEVTGTLTLRG